MDKNTKSAKEVQSIRTQLGLTQAEFAEQVGVTPLTIARWETGTRQCRGKYSRAVGALLAAKSGFGRGVSSIWSAGTPDLQGLDKVQAIYTFRDLLWCLARRYGVPSTAVNITDRIDVADGGVDARILTDRPIPSESPLLKGRSYYQIKTGSHATPWKKADAKAETKSLLNGKSGAALREELTSLDHYVYVHFGVDPTEPQRKKAISNLEECFKGAGYNAISVEFLGQNQLIGLVNDYPSLALGIRGDSELEFLSHGAWSQNAQMSTRLHIGERQQKQVEKIRAFLRGDAIRHIRLLGEPGIGKTRMALEALNTPDLAPLVVYVPHAEDFEKSTLFTQILRTDNPYYVILVIDECRNKHRASIWDAIKRRSDRCKLITIDHGPDDSSDEMMEIIACAPLERKQIEEIIGEYLEDKLGVSRWVDICEGSPRVAHVVGENLRRNPDDILKEPSTVNLWERFVAGYEDINDDSVRRRQIVLQHASLFERFGYEEPVEAEGDYLFSLIQKSAPEIGRAEFDNIILDLRKRRIIQGKVTLFIVPRALQIYLWCKFWDVYGRSLSIQNGLSSMPEGLRQWFMNSFRYANDAKIAKKKVQKLLSADGIFEDREFLYSSIGSRFLSILAEVVPGEVIDLLERTVGKESIEYLLNFSDGRQHIVWALEKIATCEASLFCRSASLLLRLAVAENANFSNNSTGTFAGLFSLAFGGVASSAAPPEKRFPVLEQALKSEERIERALGLKACAAALEDPSNRIRTVGPEFQGLRRVDLWRPKIWGEYFDAYERIWRQVEQFWFDHAGKDREEAAQVLVQAAHYALQVSHLAPKAIATLKQISGDSPTVDRSLVQVIAWAVRFSRDSIQPSILSELKELDKEITGTDFESRIRRYVLLSTWDEEFDDDEENGETGLTKAINQLAKDAVDQLDAVEGILEELIQNEGHGSFEFGLSLGREDAKFSVWKRLRREILTHSNSTVSHFVSGYLTALFERDPKLWESEILSLFKDSKRQKTIAYICLDSGMSPAVFDEIVNLIESNVESPDIHRRLRHTRHLSGIGDQKIHQLLRVLIKIADVEAIETSLTVLDRMCCKKSGARKLPRSLTRQVLLHEANFGDRVPDMQSYHWKQVADEYIRMYPKDRMQVFEVIVSGMTHWRYGFYASDLCGDVLEQIIADNAEGCWDIISKSLKDDFKSDKARGIHSWLQFRDSQRAQRRGHKSSILLFPVDVILGWVEKAPTHRAPFIASVVYPSLDHDGEGKLTYELLSRHGMISDVKRELYIAFGHGGGWGPISEHYRKKQTIARKWLQDANDPHVQQWLEDYISSLQYNIDRFEIEEEREF